MTNSAIPEDIRDLVLAQRGNVRRTAKELAKTELLKLGIRAGSEIYEFFTEFNITLFISQTSYEQLCDVCEPTPQIWDGTVFVREVWGVPEEFVCLTSAEGEGCYLYSNTTEAVYDFELADRENFLKTGKFLED